MLFCPWLLPSLHSICNERPSAQGKLGTNSFPVKKSDDAGKKPVGYCWSGVRLVGSVIGHELTKVGRIGGALSRLPFKFPSFVDTQDDCTQVMVFPARGEWVLLVPWTSLLGLKGMLRYRKILIVSPLLPGNKPLPHQISGTRFLQPCSQGFSREIWKGPNFKGKTLETRLKIPADS